MVASIGAVAAPAQCVAYFERDDYYAKALRKRLEAATGERIAALEAIGAGKAGSREAEKQAEATQAMEQRTPVMEKTRSDRGMEL